MTLAVGCGAVSVVTGTGSGELQVLPEPAPLKTSGSGAANGRGTFASSRSGHSAMLSRARAWYEVGSIEEGDALSLGGRSLRASSNGSRSEGYRGGRGLRRD